MKRKKVTGGNLSYCATVVDGRDFDDGKRLDFTYYYTTSLIENY